MNNLLEYATAWTQKYHRTKGLMEGIKNCDTMEELNILVNDNREFIDLVPDLWHSIKATRIRIARVRKESKKNWNLTDKN